MFNMSVISKAFAEGNEERLATECMGTGPFALGELRAGEILTLVKNPHYWEEGLPLLDGVDVNLVPDDNARILQLQGGELDGMMDVPCSRVPELQADPNLKVYQFPSTYTRYIVLNVREAPLDDVHARRALQYATDRQTLVDVVLFGTGIPATSFMPKGALYWNDTLEGYPYDLAKAQEELAQSATPEGFALELTTLAGFVRRRDDGDRAQGHVEPDRRRGHDHPLETSVFNEAFTNGEVPDDVQSIGQMTSSTPTSSSASPCSPRSARRSTPAGRMPRRRSWRGRARPRRTRRSARRSISGSRRSTARNRRCCRSTTSRIVNVTTTRVHNFQHPPTGQYDWKTTWMEQG